MATRAAGARRLSERRARRTAALCLAPWVVGFALFTLGPLLASLYWSFTRYDLLRPAEWVGLANYRYLLDGDPMFWPALRNTLWMVAVGIPVQLVAAVGSALLLVRPRRGLAVHRTIWYLPSLAPPVAATLAFAYLLDPAYGPVNRVLGAVGLPEPLWFYDPGAAKPGLVLLALWGVGDSMIVLLAGMLRIPRELYDAADLEGARRSQRFRRVTLPMIAPVVLFTVVLGLVTSFGTFTQGYIASSVVTDGAGAHTGAPEGSTLFLSSYLYGRGYRHLALGHASAIGWVMVVLTIVSVVAALRIGRRWVRFEATPA